MAETTNHFLDGPGLSRVWTKIKNLVNKKSVKSITRSGNNFTAKNESGETLFSFDQKDTTYSVVGAKNTTGLVKNGSDVTSASGYTAAPIIGGVPYYYDTTYSAATAQANGLMTKKQVADLGYSFMNANFDEQTRKLTFYRNNEQTVNVTFPVADSSRAGVVKSGSTVTSKTGLTACPIIDGVPYYQNTGLGSVSYSSSSRQLVFTRVNGGSASVTLPEAAENAHGLVKTTSTVKTSSGYTACPIIGGVPYYKNTTYSNANASADGLMSSAMYNKLNALGKQTTHTFTGTHFEHTMNKNSDAWQAITSSGHTFDLPAGTWLLFATALFPKNSSAKRFGLSIVPSTYSDKASTVIRRDIEDAEANGDTWCNVVCPVVHTSQTVYNVALRDTANLGLKVDVSITCIRIC